MPKLSEMLFGKGEKTEKVQLLDPAQQQLQSQLMQLLGPLLQQGGGYLGGLFGEGAPEQFAAPFMRQFQEEIVPGIAERFTEAGGQRSSAFAQQLGKAGAGLEEQLASLQGQLSQQGLQSLMGLLGAGLTPTQQSVFRPQTGGLAGGLVGGLGQGLGTALGALLV